MLYKIYFRVFFFRVKGFSFAKVAKVVIPHVYGLLVHSKLGLGIHVTNINYRF